MQDLNLDGIELYLAVHIFICMVFTIAHSFTYEKNEAQELTKNDIRYSKVSIFVLIIGYIVYIVFAVFRKIEMDMVG